MELTHPSRRFDLVISHASGVLIELQEDDRLVETDKQLFLARLEITDYRSVPERVIPAQHPVRVFLLVELSKATELIQHLEYRVGLLES